MEQSDVNLDNFIKDRLRGARTSGAGIEPSPDFTAHTMAQVMRVERRRRLERDIFAVGLSVMPIVLQRGWWYLARGRDYFSVSALPMGDFLVGAYQIFLSSLGLALLAVVGVLTFVSYIRKFRRVPQFSKIA